MAELSGTLEGVSTQQGAQLYEPAEAARLLQMGATRVRRWLSGYHYEYRGTTRRKGPLVHGHRVGERYASFLDLMELLFARAFIREGIPVQRIRRALAEAKDVLGLDHPFARQLFFTDGKKLYLKVRGREGADNLLQLLSRGQWVIAPVVIEYARQIDFASVSGEAERWWPKGRAFPVIVDPHVSFGAPTVAGTRIRTAVLYDLYLAERKSIGAVSRWMDIDSPLVQAAVTWEEDMQRQKAA